ncbi:hypothetical protein MCOR25_009928 [Pyricularia grisea]|nr:hypothetical protein MCOR25_009928 [Pyricularia grisea]
MHCLSLLLIVAPVAVLGSNVTMGRGTIGGKCCDNGVDDDSGVCAKMGMNSYGCTDMDNSKGHGCDKLPSWPIGREVKYFVAGSNVTHTNPENYDIELGYIGCAE